MNEFVKKSLFDYWSKNGVDTSQETLNIFSVSRRTYGDEEMVRDLVYEYYGGVDELLKKLKKLEGGILYGNSFGGDRLRGRVFDVVYDKGDKEFYCSVLVDGDVEIEEMEGHLSTLYDEYTNEGMDRDFSQGLEVELQDLLYDQITKKTGAVMHLGGFEITEPNKF